MLDSELQFNVQSAGKNGTVTIKALLGDDIVEYRTLDLSKGKTRKDFVRDICKAVPAAEPDDVEKQLIQVAAKAEDGTPKETEPQRARSDDLLAKMPEHVRAEARVRLESPDLMQHIIDDVAALGVAGEQKLTGTIYLTGTSRLLSSPLSIIVQGPSSSGKSFLIDRVAKLFPPEAVLKATQQTPQSLYYLPPGSLVHRFVVAGERSRVQDDSTAEATRALREMQSGGTLSKLVPVKEVGRMVTKHIEQDGPIAFIESTTLTRIFEEDANRCILLNTDERPNQTRRIVTKLAGKYCGDHGGDEQRIVDQHHALQCMLQPHPIVIPYAMRLGELFTSERVEVRRAFPQLMSMVKASCLLHQRQRQFDDQHRLIASADDYEIARHLLTGPLSRLLGERTSDAAQRFFQRLSGRFHAGRHFTTTESAKGDAQQRTVSGWLSELCGADIVTQVESHRGNRPAVWVINNLDGDHDDRCLQLPQAEDLLCD